MKCRWTHIIDSHGPASTPDEGSFTPLPNGDSLESGTMACPARNGAMTPYEEVWRELSPLPGPSWGWILQSLGDEGKIFLARIGGGFLALCEGREGFGARREEWDSQGEGEWVEMCALGNMSALPSMRQLGEMVNGEEGWRMGDVVTVEGREFVVRAHEMLNG